MSQSWVGKTIGGRYKIEALLGQGGMSAVYRASDPNLRRKVAVKMIHPHLSDDPNFISRFKEEAAAVARLRHPNIVQVHDFNVDGDTYFMVMEYLVGETLQARLKRLNATGRQMPLEDAMQVCLQLCEATGYAHNQDLVHRDIKPANIMLNVNGQAILMDFGIVKIVGGDTHTATGATLGTAMYMSPEQIRSVRVDERADIYSLGVTLYEILSGQPPYMADSAPSLMMKVLNDPLPDLGQVRKGIPESLLAAVNKALAKDATERFQTMKEMASALNHAREELLNAAQAEDITEVDQGEKETDTAAASATTVVDSLESEETASAPPAGSTEAATPGTSSQEAEKEIHSAVTQQDEAEEIFSPQTASQLPSQKASTWLRSRPVKIATGVLGFAILATIGLLFLNTRKLPDVQLGSISRSVAPIESQNAHTIVSLGKWETDSYIEKLTFSPDGSLLGTANNRDWAYLSPYRYYSGLWQIQAETLPVYFPMPAQWVKDAAFSPDGQLFGSVSTDGSAFLWQVAGGNLMRKIESSYGGLTSIAFTPNNLLLATGSEDGAVGLWQVSDGNLLRTMQTDGSSLEDVDFSPDGTLLAAATNNNTILLWQVSDGRLAHTLKGHTAPIFEAIFSPDGLRLASASEDRSVKIWQVSDGSLLQSLDGHGDAVYTVAFSPDGTLLASGSGDGTLNLWQASDGKLLNSMEIQGGITSVAFSPDGHYLVSGTEDGVIQFWGISGAIPQDGE